MPTIDDIGLDEYSRYARESKAYEDFVDEYGVASISDSRIVPIHLQVLDEIVKPEATEVIFGSTKISWAHFPKKEIQRTFHFDISNSIEKDEADLKKIKTIDCSSKDTREEMRLLNEKNKILALCQKQTQLRKDYEFVISRIHQFIQG